MLLCVGSYLAGAFIHGHRYVEREVDIHPFAFGELKEVRGIDQSGVSLLSFGTDWIEFTGECPVDYSVILFRADKRVRSPKPQLKDLTVNGKDISWNDTVYAYSLHIDWLGSVTGEGTQGSDHNSSEPLP